jgi:hypothetical protein
MRNEKKEEESARREAKAADIYISEYVGDRRQSGEAGIRGGRFTRNGKAKSERADAVKEMAFEALYGQYLQ